MAFEKSIVTVSIANTDTAISTGAGVIKGLRITAPAAGATVTVKIGTVVLMTLALDASDTFVDDTPLVLESGDTLNVASDTVGVVVMVGKAV